MQLDNNSKSDLVLEENFSGKWLRYIGFSQLVLQDIEKRTGFLPELKQDLSSYQDKNFSYHFIDYISPFYGTYVQVRLSLIIHNDLLITIEDSKTSTLNRAIKNLNDIGNYDLSPYEVASTIIHSVNDTTDYLIDILNQLMTNMVVNTSSILHHLEVKSKKDKDFGISDVTYIQKNLTEISDILNQSISAQINLYSISRDIINRASDNAEVVKSYELLMGDINSVSEHLEFINKRVRVLQQTNNMALSVKQNQIVKVFSVITAIFLPAMLVTTYYSMNFEFMPILDWIYGEPFVMFITLLLALCPLMYIKKRGWLR
ncbi:hypothetical protein CUL92_18540 [Salmonella enterica subsp. enterica serovar Telelkebir]|nr:hypothetical protein [Salmonella enterica subsp. enterica serovar Telelkebir]ECU9605496.1 hypothetical protein [Salmonella enterica subsp. enterica serovar Telelkebir]